MNTKDTVVGIDLFSGAGGMTLGARQAGVKVVFAIEKCPRAAATYKLNFPDVPVHIGDIKDVRSLPAKPKSATTILFGGPPCQGFSTSNQRTRNAQNPDNWLFEEFVRLSRSWRPDWVILENVKGIKETEGGFFFSAAIESLQQIGYEVSSGMLNSVDYGVPQRRTRTFIVGARDGSRVELPKQRPGESITVYDAIADLPSLPNGAGIDELSYGEKPPSRYAKQLRNGVPTVTGNLVTKNAPHILKRYTFVPPGGNWTNIPAHLLSQYANLDNCHTGIYRRLDASTPSVVIGNYRKNMLIHPTQNRGLSVREAARIQSIPDWFRFSGSIGFQQQQVGNMVPPRLAAAVLASVTGVGVEA